MGEKTLCVLLFPKAPFRMKGPFVSPRIWEYKFRGIQSLHSGKENENCSPKPDNENDRLTSECWIFAGGPQRETI